MASSSSRNPVSTTMATSGASTRAWPNVSMPWLSGRPKSRRIASKPSRLRQRTASPSDSTCVSANRTGVASSSNSLTSRASAGLSSASRTLSGGSGNGLIAPFSGVRQLHDLEPELLDGLHYLEKLFQVQGLGDVRVGAQSVALEDVLFRLRRREDHHRNVLQPVVLLDLLEHLAAAFLRQVEVEEDDIRAGCLRVPSFLAEQRH